MFYGNILYVGYIIEIIIQIIPMNINDTSLLSLYAASFHVFENVAKPSLPLSRSCCRNAQAVLNVPLVLIVQPRKHRKLPTTSV